LYPRLDRAADCHVQAAPSHQQREDGKSVEALSPREHEVLQLMARGLQNKEIAAEPVISERTVKFHVSSILGKLGAGNRTEAVTMALQQGLIEQ
jgi:DNA-binding NarL/FixJ family response regulator